MYENVLIYGERKLCGDSYDKKKNETNQLSHKVSLQMHKDSIKNLFFLSFLFLLWSFQSHA